MSSRRSFYRDVEREVAHRFIRLESDISDSDVSIDVHSQFNQSIQSVSYVDINVNSQVDFDVDTDFETSQTSSLIDSNDNETDSLRLDLAAVASDPKICGSTMNKVLSVIKKYHPDIPSDVRTLRKTPKKSDVQQLVLGGSFFYFGVRKALLKFFKKHNFSPDIEIIEIDVNTDGTPLAKSSRSELWPILINVVNYVDVLVIGAYEGKGKMKDVNLFWSRFVDEINDIKLNGIIYNNVRIDVNIRAFICDAPARAMILFVKLHSGYWSCTRCTTKGIKGRTVPKFTETEASLRTNQSFRSRQQPEHHHSLNPGALENIIDLDCVTQVVIDYMHCCLEGVVNQILKLFIKVRRKPFSLTKDKIDELNQMIESLKKFPSEFCRKPRTLNEMSFFKATEFRRFLLYDGPVILKYILTTVYYNNFMKLSCAFRILLNDEDCIRNNECARQLLKSFVEEFNILFGDVAMTFNVHSLIHVADDALKFGALDQISTFKFENALQIIKNMIHSGYLPLQQLSNRIHEQYLLNDTVVAKSFPILKHKCLENCFKSVSFKNFQLTTAFPNNYCLVDDCVFKVVLIYETEIECCQVIHLNSYFDTPICSTNLKIFSTSIGETVDEISHRFEFDKIQSKLVKLELECKNIIVYLPMIHSTHSTFSSNEN